VRWLVGTGLFLVLLELALRFFVPVPTLYPGLMPSASYRHVPFATMTHTLPSGWRFVYPVADGVRGGMPDSVQTIVLGDSYAFGVGSSISFADLLPDCLNLSIPNSGFAQAVLRYRDHGPSDTVVIQYYHNDPRDTVRDRAYLAGPQPVARFDRFLARTPLRRLQLWSRVMSHRKPAPVTDDSCALYCSLLAQFVCGMDARILFVTQGDWLAVYPMVESTVRYLEATDRLEVVDVQPALPPDHRSPEGHKWNTAAHEKIADAIQKVLDSP